MTKSPHQVYSEREAETEELANKYAYDRPHSVEQATEKRDLMIEDINIHNRKTLHAVIDAMIEREEELMFIPPESLAITMSDAKRGYNKAKQDTINYLKEVKSKLKDK